MRIKIDCISYFICKGGSIRLLVPPYIPFPIEFELYSGYFSSKQYRLLNKRGAQSFSNGVVFLSPNGYSLYADTLGATMILTTIASHTHPIWLNRQ